MFLPLKHSMLTAALVLAMSTQACAADFEQMAHQAPVHRGKTPVRPMDDNNILAEAEEFEVVSPAGDQGWRAKDWGENYFAATFFNTFLSRKAFLGASAEATDSVAQITVEVPADGTYLALVRYEAPYHFHTQFTLQVEQNGKVILDRLYGSRDNDRIWPLREGLKKEVRWSWGAVENIVWEGDDATVTLAKGTATLRLIAKDQPTPAAKRNIDCVLLTSEIEYARSLIPTARNLPFDGMLTQQGDVWMKVHNTSAVPLAVNVPKGQEHSPYWVHKRRWQVRKIEVGANESSDWVEVGNLLDALNDGQWKITGATADKSDATYKIDIGLKDAAGNMKTIKQFDVTNDIELAYDANTRYTGRIRTTDEVLYDYLAYLKAHPPTHGKVPNQTVIYCYTFSKRVGENLSPADVKYNAARQEMIDMFGLAMSHSEVPLEGSKKPVVFGYIDVRSLSNDELEEACLKMVADGTAASIRTVSFGDEIGLPQPPAGSHDAMRKWAQDKGYKPSEINPDAGDDWSKVMYTPGKDVRATNPAGYYYSQLFAQDFGIAALKTRTEIVQKYLPNADTGANFSPHHPPQYLGEAHKWITLFRQGGMTQPWSEDYIWQVPVGSQQMNSILMDLMRAGNRYNPERDIHFYVMPHWPGNTVNSWRRLFYSALGTGMTIVNLFEFRPVQVAYTENHTSLPEMYTTVRDAFYELGSFEDIVQSGNVRWGNVGLWYSRAGDSWHDDEVPFGPNKRALYVAIRHQQVQLDIVDEDDALRGTLASYKVIYLTERHVSTHASQALADWVKAGGTLFATAGAGMRDQYDKPNTILQDLMGVKETELQIDTEQPLDYEKQDLPFYQPIGEVKIADATTPVIGARSMVEVASGDATVSATFKDGKPAMVVNKTGQGQTYYAAFLPGLSYFKPAMPMMPVDRGSTDDASAHFIPTEFDATANEIIGMPVKDIARPVTTSNPLVQATIIDSEKGMAIVLANWAGKPIKGLKVTLHEAIGAKSVTLATAGEVHTARGEAEAIFTLDLDVADTIIVR